VAERLTDDGKPFKLMIVACMHKLLTILNAMTGRKWHDTTLDKNLVANP
jgi:hypothetical protein